MISAPEQSLARADAQHKASVLTKAVARAAEQLGLSRSLLARVLGALWGLGEGDAVILHGSLTKKSSVGLPHDEPCRLSVSRNLHDVTQSHLKPFS